MSIFVDQAAALVEERRSQICLGLDPDPANLGDLAFDFDESPKSAAERAGDAVSIFCRKVIEAAGPACVAVKPQLACFERLGWPGWRALEEVCLASREAGLLVVADGKRGDVPVSAKAYGQAMVGQTESPWGTVTGLNADAFTANPMLGADALEPLVAAAESAGAGVFALVRTSNPGAADVQDLPTPDGPVHERLAALVDRFGPRLAGQTPNLSGMGAVVGATAPEHIARLRELMPRAMFLIPGVGAQGGRPEDLGAAFKPGRAAALIAASRSIAGAADPGAAAEELRRAVWEISG
ncbi:MAG TPA: orotidine-5'-phosphate decarboxylase [Solirubrobacterales bacterium]|nr:orotidine-5'-phosphate decarboxylase [Solirubrobacterales bacterium]